MRTRRGLALCAAIVVEVSATLALKAALTAPVWYLVVVAGYACAFLLLAVCLRLGMPVGVTYGLWGASGVFLTAVSGSILFGEPVTPLMAVGLGLIIGGVLFIELSARHSGGPAVPRDDAR